MKLSPLNFEQEVMLLQQQYNPVVLSEGKRQLIVLPELQGRVMTSTAKGNTSQSIGWINYEYLSKPHHDNNAIIGGADRLWFGPDASRFSLFFEPGVETTGENIRVQDAMSTVGFETTKQTQTHISMQQALTLINYQGFTFEFELEREVTLLSKTQTEQQLDIDIPPTIDFVSYATSTKVTNTSHQDWSKQTGLFSIWDLGAFHPSNSTTVVIPMTQNLDQATWYFSDVVDSHTRIKDKVVYYKADAKYMNKIGIPPQHTLPLFGSYDASRNLLTIITFAMSKEPHASYVNATWDFSADPYAGEIINVFNDGPNEQGIPFGPFYEMETSSQGLELKQGQSHSHRHSTYHFIGEENQLNLLSSQLLGVDISMIKSIFN
ncbi:hypothetical protein C2869_01770 [Saccharobesus litoralis]|uniref:Uncharacterized protein n=1 Tax=Saccharobesus litoralis TaxID=2172099 RepID=A0A2S0VM31_9ALTE|nr:DUF6786 family protein [Saccharobesus litoralis]AWB65249.1 hypothetical protein C2869_01770 [Saccharobesus litoralis]